MNKESRIAQLLVKLVRQDLTQDEGLELENWRNASASHQRIVEEATQEEAILRDLKLYMEMDIGSLQRKIQAGISQAGEPAPVPISKPIFRRLAPYLAAASVLACLISGYLLWYPGRTKQEPVIAKDDKDSFFLRNLPALGPVSLTLGDGSTMYPDSLNEGPVIKQGGIQVSIGDDGRSLVYERAESWKTDPAQAIYNTLTVPYGNQYRLRLSDGTKVFLHVGASLRYPAVFAGHKRVVGLSGEAFFETARDDAHPFIVNTRRSTTEVIGTSFALSDYLNDPYPLVLVQSGKIKVHSGTAVTEVKAGQKAIIQVNGIQVDPNANLREELSWKEDYFNFDGLDIKAALYQLAKSYRMHVLFEDNVKSGSLGQGYIQRDLPLNILLKGLELPDLHFDIRMQDSTIVVKR